MSASVRNPNFVLRRLHSLFGLIPVGGFLVFHLWENTHSRFGAEYYNEHVVQKIQGINYLPIIEIFVLALPILFHALYGLKIAKQTKSNLHQYGTFRNWMWWAQRVSGVGILAFLIFHVGWTRILSIWRPEVAEDMFSHMRGMLSHPVALAAYFLGMVLSVFHLSNGLWTMGITWGVTTTPRGQKTSFVLVTIFGLLLLALGIHGLLGFLLETPVATP